MFRNLAIISFAFFLLSGNFANFDLINNLPIDISIIAMLVPAAYFGIFTLKNMAVHKVSLISLFFFITLIPTIFYIDGDSLKLGMFLVMFFTLTLFSPVFLSDEKSAKLFIKSLFATSMAIATLSLIGLDVSSNTNARMTLDGGNPIWLGRAVSIAALILLILLFHNRIKFVWFVILFSAPFIVLMSAGSKGPIIGVAIALLLVFFNKIRKFMSSPKFLRNSFLILIVILPISLISYLISPKSFLRLFDYTSESVTSTRLLLFKDAIDASKNNPWGVGIGNFDKHSFFTYPHNLILEAFAELGWIPGLTFLLILIISTLGFLKLSKGNVIGDILFAIFIVALVNSMVSGDLTSPKELYVLLPVGLSALFIKGYSIKSKTPNVA